MKTYITFGQVHEHHIDGKIFDKDCVAVIVSESPEAGRKKAFELFGSKFAFEYPETWWDEKKITYFPRGYIEV